MSIQSYRVRQKGGQLILLGLTLVSLRWAQSLFGQALRISNPDRIVIPLGEPVSPYPSTITVGEMAGEIANISVTVSNLTHSTPDNIDLLLTGPRGQAVLLMSDAGGDADVSNVTLTFSDRNTAKLPESSQIRSGSYAPSNFDSRDILPAPAPAGPFGSDLTIFHGTNPAGVWRLFVHDDSAQTRGSIAGGWVLDLSLVDQPPVIIRQPRGQTVEPGTDVTFEVSVTGTGSFGYQWLRNGQILVPFGKGTPQLTLKTVQAADAGTYNVVVTNRANPSPGVTSLDAVLNVTGRLILAEQPGDQIRPAGDSVVLYAAAAGTPPLLYQWHLNGAVIPGETNATLALSNLQSADGGSYSVLIYNETQWLRTGPARLLISASTALPPTDHFQDRPRLSGTRGTLQGNSSPARTDANEPVSPGGGKSVWVEWTAPADGIVSVDTRGSTFDTLLNVFTGLDLGNLALVATDDDRGGFQTSSLQFNVRNGVNYQFSIDGLGFGGAGGDFTLSWELETTSELIPTLAVTPSSQVTSPGGTATLEVVTESARDRYQWMFKGERIPGATNSTYAITNAAPAQVGLYSVRISNDSGRSIQSAPVQVQLASGDLVLVHDKVEHLFLPSANGNRPTQGFIAIGLGGVVFTNHFYSLAGRQAFDPDPCDNPFFGTLWLGLTATNNGLIQVETTGSQIPARLAVYQLTGGLNDFNVPAIVCDVTSGRAGKPCVAKFQAIHGTNYTVVVEGLNSTGILKLVSQMGSAPRLSQEPRCLQVGPGGDLVLEVPANTWTPAPQYQWRLNGQAIPNANSASWWIHNFNEALAGAYSVVLSNFVGAVTQAVAQVTSSGPYRLNHFLVDNNGSRSLVLSSSAAQSLVLEMAPAMEAPWSPVFTNKDPCTPLTFTNSNLFLEPRRFYRAIRWPVPNL